MNNSKPAVRSVGVIGSITGIIGFLGVIPDLIGLFQSLQPAVQEIINQVAVLIGLVLALWGRIRADKTISGILFKK